MMVPDIPWERVSAVAFAVLIAVGGLGAASVVGGVGAASAAAPTAAEDGAGRTLAEGQDLHLEVDVRWSSDRPDRVEYTYTFTAPDSAEFVLLVEAEVGSVAGFTGTGDGTLVYDGSADTHRVTVVQSVERAAETRDWVYSADSGVLVPPPRLSVAWGEGRNATRANPLAREFENVAIDYGAHAGFREWRRLYVGPYTTYETEHGGETITVYRPALADDGAYERAVRSVAATSDRVPMADGPARATFVVFPVGEGENDAVHTYSDSVYVGFAEGGPENSGIVDSDRAVDSYDNTWAHEYVHFQQGFRTGPETRWLREAQAEYLTATAMHAAGCGDGNLRRWLGVSEETADDVLSNGSTWGTDTPYEKGPAVLGQFAARLHAETGGRTTALDVFRELEDEHVRTHDGFVERVNRTVAADSREVSARYLDRYVTTADSPGDGAIDHPPLERASACLAAYRHVTVTETIHRGDSTTTVPSTPPPTETATPVQTPAQTPPTVASTGVSTPTAPSTATPAEQPAAGGGDLGSGTHGTNWLESLWHLLPRLGLRLSVGPGLLLSVVVGRASGGRAERESNRG